MNENEYLKCSCKECGNHIEFPPAARGTTVACPHCGEWTELVADEPAVEETTKSKLPLLLAAVGVVAVAGAVGAFLFLRGHAKEVSATPAPVPAKVMAPPTNLPHTNVAPAKPVIVEKKEKSLDDLKPGTVNLEKAKVGNLVYAVGTITNVSEYQRFGVKVELDLFNKKGAKIGSTTDYKDVIEPNREWQFHAMVLDPKTTSAKVSSIKEE